jgi:hypothetical protein
MPSTRVSPEQFEVKNDLEWASGLDAGLQVIDLLELFSHEPRGNPRLIVFFE